MALMGEGVDNLTQNTVHIRKGGTFLARCGPSPFEREDFWRDGRIPGGMENPVCSGDVLGMGTPV